MLRRNTYKEINSGGGGTGATQTEIYEIFEGTNSQGKADSLFETLSGNDNPLANLLIESKSGNFDTSADLLFFVLQKLLDIETELNSQATSTNQVTGNTSLSSIDTKLSTENNNSENTATYLSTIRTPYLTSITGSLTIAVQIHNLSIYNSGSAAGTINVDGGGAISIPSGVTVNFDAGGNNNRYAVNKFVLNATGTTFLVSYTQ